MKRVHCRLAFVLTVVAGLLIATSATSPAEAAADRRGPILRVPAVSSLVLGQNLTDPYDLEGDGYLDFMTGGGDVEYRWTMTDASGICRYTIYLENSVEGWSEAPVVDRRTNATSGRFGYRADQYFNSDDLSRIRITAYDCAGNSTTVERSGSYLSVTKDLGPQVPTGWSQTTCSCFMGDTTLRTSTYQRSVRTVVNAGGEARSYALIMAKGPARGKANIYLDGKYRATVDTYAAANSNRVVVWRTVLDDADDHAITVVNLATSGRPRIDVDAVVANG